MNIDENRIREFAHQIWQSEGCPDGQAHRHWEMACRLAAADEPQNSVATGQQKLADAPQHTTVLHNDLDTINQPKKAKAKALKKTQVADGAGLSDTSVERMAPSDLNSAAPAKTKRKSKKAVAAGDLDAGNLKAGNLDGGAVNEPQSAPQKVSFAKDGGQKSSRRKKAQTLADVINTEVPNI